MVALSGFTSEIPAKDSVLSHDLVDVMCSTDCSHHILHLLKSCKCSLYTLALFRQVLL